jgi:cellulose synthase/poly-beta-1,6-N-acetylglucosamine synthase-like glycosyltransferase
MGTALQDGLAYLAAQPASTLFLTFWFVLLLEVPHYSLRFAAAASSHLFAALSRKQDAVPAAIGRITAVIAGHNEACAIERCVASIHEQSLKPDEIIVVSDGSTDKMPRKLQALADAGLIDYYYKSDLRGGKAAGLNLGAYRATGDIIVNIDCDCSLDRFAIEELVKPFSDPAMGAVCGNIFVRNQEVGLLTKFQAIEYLITISLGKVAAGLIGQVVCISGAFGAYRRAAYEAIHGSDPGGGEDLDLTLRLRKAGWRMGFAPDSIVATDVPETLKALLRQRFRWDRDALGLRYRKHRELMNPFSRRFRPSELFHELEFLVFIILPAAVFPFYVLWLFDLYGAFAFAILIAAQAGLFLLDIASFLLAGLANPKAKSLGLMLYLPGYSLYSGYFMRFVRLFAFVQEWIFSASRKDPYVPEKVLRTRSW